MRKETFKGGKEEGLLVEFDEEGKIITKGKYRKGNKKGKWIVEVGDHIDGVWEIVGKEVSKHAEWIAGATEDSNTATEA